MKRFAISYLVVLFLKLNGQINITSVYNQNFGTSDITSWTNNSTFPGWYIQSTGTAATFQSHINITSTAIISNNGGYYSYECNSDNNQKIGTRPSNSVGAANGIDIDGNDNGIYMGVRFVNNTGNTCTSVRITYTGYQLSLAENGNAVNRFKFSYKTSASPITSLLGTGWTMFPMLDYIAPNNSSTSGSNQISSYVCNVNTSVNSCVLTGINIPNGYEAVFRWGDLNNNSNDPHIAIDDVQIEFFNDIICLIPLPIDLLDFYATKNDNKNEVFWKVASEESVNKYIIEKSFDAINFIEIGAVFPNNLIGKKTYSIIDDEPYNDITYYRLKTIETNGNNLNQKVISIDRKDNNWNYVYYQTENDLCFDFKNNAPKTGTINLFDITGKLIKSENINSTHQLISTINITKGLYFIQIVTPYKTENIKIIIN